MLGKTYLVDNLVNDLGLTRVTADRIVENVLDSIYNGIMNNEVVRLNGVGVLRQKTLAPRTFKTPSGSVSKPERIGVKFTPSDSIVAELND